LTEELEVVLPTILMMDLSTDLLVEIIPLIMLMLWKVPFILKEKLPKQPLMLPHIFSDLNDYLINIVYNKYC